MMPRIFLEHPLWETTRKDCAMMGVTGYSDILKRTATGVATFYWAHRTICRKKQYPGVADAGGCGPTGGFSGQSAGKTSS
jgi:hypothetical protein